MKNLSFQEILDAINVVFAKNQMKPALKVEIQATIVDNDAVNDYLIISLYQRERSANGLLVFHAFTCESLPALKFQLQASIDEKSRL